MVVVLFLMFIYREKEVRECIDFYLNSSAISAWPSTELRDSVVTTFLQYFSLSLDVLKAIADNFGVEHSRYLELVGYHGEVDTNVDQIASCASDTNYSLIHYSQPPHIRYSSPQKCMV